jgi:hypothetical protein
MKCSRLLSNVIPAKAGIHDSSQPGDALGGVEQLEACVDGRLRGHDALESLEFSTQRFA